MLFDKHIYNHIHSYNYNYTYNLSHKHIYNTDMNQNTPHKDTNTDRCNYKNICNYMPCYIYIYNCKQWYMHIYIRRNNHFDIHKLRGI
jgi:hypothetical protein